MNGFRPDGRDVVFVPVGLNYDRVLEDRILLAHEKTADGRARFRVSAAQAMGFFVRLMWLRMTGRLYRFGYACVSFGEPLSLKAWLARPAADVEGLGHELTRRIGQVIPVLPVSLISRVLLAADGPLSIIDLKLRAEAELERLHAAGAHSHVPRSDLGYAVEVAIRMLRLRRIVGESEAGLEVRPAEREVLGYYANAIAHLAGEEAAKAPA